MGVTPVSAVNKSKICIPDSEESFSTAKKEIQKSQEFKGK